MENQMGCETNGKQPHAMEPVNLDSDGRSPTLESSSSPPPQQSTENHITVRLVGVQEMAEILSVPVSWLYENTHKKKIPHAKVGRYLRYSPVEVTEFFKVNYNQIEK